MVAQLLDLHLTKLYLPYGTRLAFRSFAVPYCTAREGHNSVRRACLSCTGGRGTALLLRFATLLHSLTQLLIDVKHVPGDKGLSWLLTHAAAAQKTSARPGSTARPAAVR